MKKILSLVLLIVSIQSFGQNPPGYKSKIVKDKLQSSFMVDSGLHILRGCGNPSGVRGWASLKDGAVTIDTCGNRLYIYSGGGWSLVGGDNLNIFKRKGIAAFYDNFSRTNVGSDYGIAFPATTTTISSDGLNLVGTPNNYSNYISRIFYTASENFSLKLTYVNNTISATTYCVAIGMKSQNTNCCQHIISAGVYQNTGNSDLGKSFITGLTYSYTSVGSDNISSISAGDTIEIEMK